MGAWLTLCSRDEEVGLAAIVTAMTEVLCGKLEMDMNCADIW